MAEITGQMEVDGLVRQRKELDSLMMSNPQMEKKVQGLIRKVLLSARRIVAAEAKASMKADPRQAYKAVKTAVYKRILGGSVSILNKRRASGGTSGYEPPRKIREGKRGGNRRLRSARTQQVMDYQGSDRAFILRFLNAGTDGRNTRYGFRGAIGARNFFTSSSTKAMREAADQLSSLIDELIRKELN